MSCFLVFTWLFFVMLFFVSIKERLNKCYSLVTLYSAFLIDCILCCEDQLCWSDVIVKAVLLQHLKTCKYTHTAVVTRCIRIPIYSWCNHIFSNLSYNFFLTFHQFYITYMALVHPKALAERAQDVEPIDKDGRPSSYY